MPILRRVSLTLLVLILLLVVAGLAAWRFAVPPLLSGAIQRQAGGLGIDLTRLEVAALGASRLVLTDFATDGGGIAVERVTVRFDPERLWRQREVDTITVDGLQVDLAVDADGTVRIPGVTLPQNGGDGRRAGVPPLPFDRLVLEDATVTATTPAGPLTAALSGTVRAQSEAGAEVEDGAEGGVVAELSGTVSHRVGSADATFDAQVAPDGGVSASLGLSAATLAHGGWRVEGAEGWIAVVGRPGAIDSIDAAVSAARAEGPDVTLVAPSALVAASGGPWPQTAIARVRLADGDRVIGRGAVDLSLSGTDGEGGIPGEFGLDLSLDLEEARPPLDQWTPDLPVRAETASIVLALEGPVAPWLAALRRQGWPEAADGAAAHSTGRLEVAVEGLVPAGIGDGLGRADGATSDATGDGPVGGTAHGHANRAGRLAIAGDLAVDGAAVRLAGTAPWTVDLPPFEGVALPALTLEGGGEGEPRLAWHRSTAAAARQLTYAGGFALDLSTALPVGPDAEPLTGRMEAALALPEAGPPRVAVSPLVIDGGALGVAGGVLRVGELRIDGGGNAETAAAAVDGIVHFNGTLPGGVRAEDARLDLAGDLDWNGARAALHLDDCALLSAAGLAIGDAVALAEPNGLCLAQDGDGPAIAWRAMQTGGPGLDLALRLRPAEVAGRLAGLGDVQATLPETTLAGTLPLAAPKTVAPETPRHEVAPSETPPQETGPQDSGTSANGAPTDHAGLTVAWQGGSLGAPARDLTLEGLSGEAVVRPGAARGDGAARVEASFTIDRAAIDGPRPPVVPLSLTGQATVPAEGPVTASATAAAGALQARLDLTHDPATGQGRLDVTAEPISFAPGVRQPGAVFPLLAGLPVGAVTGTVSGLSGTVAWGGRLATGGRLTLDGVTVDGPFGTVSGIDGNLRAGSLSPLTLPPGQRLTADAARIGLDLGPGDIVFGLEPGLRLAVAELGFAWAGGRLSAEPFTLDLDSPDLTVVLAAQGVDLSEIAGQLPLDSLSATGTLGGRVPVRLTPDTIAIDDARLETAGPGIIRYRPAGQEASGAGQPGGVDLLMTALEDFHYDRLVLSIDGETGGDLTARIEIDGANPDLYGGWPIDLNVDVSGELAEVLRSGLRSMSIGSRSREIIERELNR